MTRRLTVTVRERIQPPGSDFFQPGELVPNVTLRIRGRFRPYVMGPTLRINSALVRGDADGRILAEIPVQLSPPFVTGPVYIQLSAPGFETSGWMRIPSDGDVTRHLMLKPLSPDQDYPTIETWDFKARVWADGQAAGVAFRRSIDNLRGRLTFNRANDSLVVHSFPSVRLEENGPFGTTLRLHLRFDTPIDGDFDDSTGYTDLNVTCRAHESTFDRSASADFLLTSDGAVPGRNMSGFARRPRRVRLVGSAVFDGDAPLGGQDMGLAILFVKD